MQAEHLPVSEGANLENISPRPFDGSDWSDPHMRAEHAADETNSRDPAGPNQRSMLGGSESSKSTAARRRCGAKMDSTPIPIREGVRELIATLARDLLRSERLTLQTAGGARHCNGSPNPSIGSVAGSQWTKAIHSSDCGRLMISATIRGAASVWQRTQFEQSCGTFESSPEPEDVPFASSVLFDSCLW